MFRYSINLRWSDEDNGYVAEVPELAGVSAVGATPEDAVTEVKDAARACVESLQEEGLPVPEPRSIPHYSGQLRLRMPKSLHARLASMAEADGISLNQYLLAALATRVGAAGVKIRGKGLRGR
jgi:predicted RNase H-like HicB family nuclease